MKLNKEWFRMLNEPIANEEYNALEKTLSSCTGDEGFYVECLQCEINYEMDFLRAKELLDVLCANAIIRVEYDPPEFLNGSKIAVPTARYFISV